MAAPSIRGHQGVLKIFQDSAEVDIVNITRAEANMESSFSRSFYVGESVGEGDQSIEGWSGSMDLEVKDSAVDDFIDALISANLAGIGVSDYTVVLTEQYANGTVSSYAYFDMQFKMSKSQPNMTEKMTKRLEWQASGRLKL